MIYSLSDWIDVSNGGRFLHTNRRIRWGWQGHSEVLWRGEGLHNRTTIDTMARYAVRILKGATRDLERLDKSVGQRSLAWQWACLPRLWQILVNFHAPPMGFFCPRYFRHVRMRRSISSFGVLLLVGSFIALEQFQQHNLFHFLIHIVENPIRSDPKAVLGD